jgi:hypothetical protein
MAHQILAHRMLQRRPRITLPAQGYKVLRHVVGRKLHRHHEPLPHEILQVLLHNLGGGLVLFSHDSRGMEKQCSLNPKSLSFVSLCLFRHKEEDEEAMTDCAR